MNNKEKIVNETINLINENVEELYEMANIQPNRTGISSVLYATFDGEHEGYKHGAGVKVKTDQGRIPIQLKPNVQIPDSINVNRLDKTVKDKVDEAVVYVKNNLDLFLKHWNGDIDDATLILELEKRK